MKDLTPATNPTAARINKLPALVLAVSWIVSGCSGSSDSIATNTQPSIDASVSDSIANDVVDEVTLTDNASTETPNDNLTGVDPLIPSTIPVTFDVTVPQYQSNELKVELDWGDTNVSASWVGDELWSATVELPTQTQHLLTVTFYDRNGEIELARVTQDFKTGSNPEESVKIGVHQFDSSLFDDDQDGMNNLEELIAGNDPYVDEDSLLTIADFYTLNSDSRMSVSDDIESRIAQQRPISTSRASLPEEWERIYEDINIDLDGNGTLRHHFYSGGRSVLIDGVRTSSGNAITWEATRVAKEDYTHTVNVTSTVTALDDNTRTYVEQIEGSNIGTYRFTWEASTNLTAKIVDGTSLCKPVAGTFTRTYRSNDSGNPTTVTTISKAEDDEYWRVISEDTSEVTESNVVVDYKVTTREFFVRDIRMGVVRDDPNSVYFICDFPDF